MSDYRTLRLEPMFVELDSGSTAVLGNTTAATGTPGRGI
jgi:hypothetical protein